MQLSGMRIGLVTVILLVLAVPALAENEGLEYLDEATELKLNATTVREMQRVVDLCETALEEGLDEGNEEFATRLLTSTLLQVAMELSSPILDQIPPHPRWLDLRREALLLLEKAIEYDPDLGEAQLLVARLQALPAGDLDRALEAANAAIEAFEGDPTLIEMLTEALVTRSTLHIDDDEAELADLDRAVELDPNSGAAWRARGFYYLDHGEYEQAVGDFLKLLEQDPTDATVHQAVAEALTSQKKYDEALEYLDEAIELDPDSGFGYTLRARVHILREDNPSALDDLTKALRANPRDLAALLLRARVYILEEDLDSAEKDIDRLLRLRPELPDAILLEALILAYREDYSGAIREMNRLLRMDPGNPEILMQIAQYYHTDSRPRRAIEIYDEILDQNEDDIEALRGKGDSLLSIGDHEEAIRQYSRALDIEPESSGILNNLAWVLSTSPDDELRDGERAVELATQACELTEFKAPHILSTLASAYAETGDFETARKWSTEAVELSEQEDEEEQTTQLREELESYEDEKPWRERKETEERPEEEEEKPSEEDLNVF